MLALALALGASVAWGGSDFVAGLAMGPMSIVAPISSAAALVPVTASVLTGARPSTAAAVGMGLVVMGAALACSEPESGAARHPGGILPGAALAVLAALCFGAFFVGMDSAAHEAGAVWAVALNRATSVSVLVFAVALMRPRVGVGRTDLAAVASVGLLDAAANAMFAFALTEGLLSTVSVLGSLYPVTTVVLAVMVLDERIAPRQAAGVAIVLAGIGLVSAHV
jgi:drug/metabolite transporter (DMT)-like permease